MSAIQLNQIITYLNPLHLLTSGKKLTCRVTLSVLDIFISLKDLLIFPLRFIGFRAYQNPPNRENLSSNDAKKYLRYMGLCAASWLCKFNFSAPFQLNTLNPTSLIHRWNSRPSSAVTDAHCFYDSQSGLKMIMATSSHDEILIAFGSFRNILSDKKISKLETLRRLIFGKPNFEESLFVGQMNAVCGNLPGFRPSIYNAADELISYLRTTPEFRSKKIILTGHCLGGAVASYVALRQGIPAICFNSLPLGAGLQTAITDANLRLNSHHVTHISSTGDYLSDNSNPFLRMLNKILTFVGVRMPANFGKRYFIPRFYANDYDNHAFTLASMMKHIGYSNEHNPEKMPDSDLAICSRPHYQ